MKKKIYKAVAVYLALSILFEMVSPTIALALTTGPSQPEMQSFEPIGTTEMVDPFSGDFNYNIPLMTVPGPNGGYPINLAYHAGAGMEEEASWVGLGWNINAGEINRQMRGLPDDFDGDIVEKVMYMKPNVTMSAKLKLSLELVDLDADIGVGLSVSGGLTYNSYHGMGLMFGTGFAAIQRDGMGYSGGVNTNYNSLSGDQDISASLSYAGTQKNSTSKYGLSFTYSSSEGAKQLSFDYSRSTTRIRKNSNTADGVTFDPEDIITKHHSAGAGVSFANSSYVPYSDMPRTGFSIGAAMDFGLDIWGVNPYVGAEIFYSKDRIKENTLRYQSYGYLYSGDRVSGGDLSLMDFNREKDAPLTKDIPAMPMPVFTNDIYYVKGQGVGGAFRPYRSDIGILTDAAVTSKNYGADLGYESAVGSTLKVASDITGSYSRSYSGGWRDPHSWSELGGANGYNFRLANAQEPLLEPAYFRNAADMTANFDESATTLQGVGSPLPLSFASGLHGSYATLGGFVQPLIDFKVSKGALGNNRLSDRPSRSQVMSYRVNEELHAPNGSTTWSDNTIYTLNHYPRNTVSGYPASPDYAALPNKHIGEITVTNPDGNRYIYGIPAYNTVNREVSFSVEGDVSGKNNPVDTDRKLVNYNAADDVGSVNSKGNDNFFSSKSLPIYAHSYLLTAIVSPDYVDLTGDGLTEDDYGYYVKFNYTKMDGTYNWRSPFVKASYIQGYESVSANDDKAGYTFGSKEIWYLNSIETKTHVAEFTLSDRKDGFGANNEHNGTSGATTDILGMGLKKLDKISLYSKADPNYSTGTPTPIKTVNLDYTYDLCGGVQNNNNTTTGTNYYTGIDRNTNHGKLTLKKVWFSYLNNNKGSVSPYEFDYHERTSYGGTINTDENPDFSTMQVDRWGNYKSDPYDPQNPYVSQKNESTADETQRNNNASAWCLKEISLPSGGKIKVDYESDDYAFVQNKQAMQMVKVLGTGHVDGGGHVIKNASGENDISDNNLLVFFELNSQQDIDATGATVPVDRNTIWKYVQGINDMYFKVYERLKHEYGNSSVYSKDYVSGYAGIDAPYAPATEDGSHYGIYEYPASSGHFLGYVKLKKINVHDTGSSSGDKTHPFRKAGWQYLKLDRPDLLYPSSSSTLPASSPAASALLHLAATITGFFTSNVQLFAGYYNYCAISGFCKQISMEKPSFIRLNAPDKIKYGGGYRVKSIRLTDTWTHTGAGDTQSEYGQEYVYRLQDGSSSGVAEYEPLIGGEEIALRTPIRYSSDYLIFKHDNLYMEYPFCESYYPAASVGYSRVIVKNIKHTDNTSADVTKGVSGIMMYEYYTARDFPVSVSASNILHPKFTPHINIPFIGNVSFNNQACSQTFTVETNDMSGKMKALSTYAYNTDLFAAAPSVPVSKTEYIYKTDAAYSASGTNHLNNLVDVLYDDAYYKQSNLGLTKEFFIDMRERSNISMTQGGQVNFELNFYPPVPVFGFVSKVSYAEGMNKSVVGMNVISRNGILMETHQYNEGSEISTKNLMFDGSTGKPLLTELTSDFDAPVYNYNYSAAWAYGQGIGPAYKDIGENVYINSSGSGVFSMHVPSPTGLDHRGFFVAGDEITGLSPQTEVFYVTNVTASTITVKNRYNALYSGTGTYAVKVIRSGRRNQLSQSNGNIVSLTNPVTARNFPLFKAWNDYIDDNAGGLPSSLTFVDCASGRTLTAGVSVSGNQVIFTLSLSLEDQAAMCSKDCKCDVIHITFPSTPYTAQYHLTKMGDHVLATELNSSHLPTGNTMTGLWIDQNSCLKECMDGVLHASAVEYTDDWTYDYADVNNNQLNSNGIPAFESYAGGKAGIWRTLRSSVYQTDRKQSTPSTDISKDGTYQNFVLFDWQNSNNPKWSWTNEVSRYNPYGYEIENRDPLNIYSAALYGYNNSVPTAIASNATYYETAFDGFEDYKNNDYSTAAAGHKHGHINLAYSGEGGSLALSSDSHSGRHSLQISSGAAYFVTTSAQHFTPLTGGKKYIVSAWFKGDDGNKVPAITISAGGTVVSTTVGASIEGWRKCDVVFTASSSTALTLNFNITGSTLKLVDDIRIMPFEGMIKTYVYDPQTLWLLAELDDQNFATFYNYDQEGTVVQVKKETAQGIRTIKTTRSNIKRQNP